MGGKVLIEEGGFSVDEIRVAGEAFGVGEVLQNVDSQRVCGKDCCGLSRKKLTSGIEWFWTVSL